MLTWLDSVKTAVSERAESLVMGLGLAAVTVATGFISYTHISALVLQEHQSWKTAHLMPIAIDGQIVIGTSYYMANAGKRRRWFGLLGFLPGLAESVIANWMSGAPYGYFAAGTATVTAQAFAVSSYLFERWLHERRTSRPAAVKTSPLAARTLAAALAAASRFPVLVSSVPQAAEPAAPGPEPEAAATFLHVHERPAGTPWGLAELVPVAEAPEPERSAQGPAPARTNVTAPDFAAHGTGWPGAFRLPGSVAPAVRGPVQQVARPAARRAVRKGTEPELTPQVIRDAHELSFTKFAEKYNTSRHYPNKIRTEHPLEEVSSNAA